MHALYNVYQQLNLVRLPDGFVDGYELESLLIAISVSLLITGRISVEWDILKREIFPEGKAIIQRQREATQKYD